MIGRSRRFLLILALGVQGVSLGGLSAAPPDEGELRQAADKADARIQLARAELRRVAGPALDALAADAEGKKFAAELMGSPGLLGDLMFSGPLPDDPAKMLRVLFSLWKSDRQGMTQIQERKMAVAVALTFGSSKWPEDKALARYEYYRDSRRRGLLHPQYDSLDTWEMRYLAATGQNGGWGTWDDDAMTWLRDNVKLTASDYTGACWQAPYRSENLFGDSIHGPNYYAPFGAMNHAKRVRDVGGVCGSLSHYGATAARANGIPAITMGEPGHCAYAVRISRGAWTPAYSLSWQRGLHTSLWGGTWTQLVLQDKVLSDKEAYEKSMAHLWQARSFGANNREAAQTAYQLALEAQPLHLPAWLEAVGFLKTDGKADSSMWQALGKSSIQALSAYPESAWDVVSAMLPSLMPLLDERAKMDFLISFHRAISKKEGPVMWNYEGALNAQSAALGGDSRVQLEFFEKVLALQSGSKSWFAPTISWGQSKFGKDPANANAFFATLAKVFASDSASANQDGLRGALRPAVIAAAESGNVEAFQSLGKAGASLRKGQTPVKTEPFAGELLSSGGLLRISSTCGWDSPENHWGVLESTGGAFHTDNQVRPYAIVRLGKLGDLSGIVIHDPSAGGQNAGRQLPLKVSVSEDGQSWSEVFRTDKSQAMWRIPLDGKATRVQFVKVERDDDRKDVFHLSAIHAYGRRLQ